MSIISCTNPFLGCWLYNPVDHAVRRWEIKWCNQSLWSSWNEVMTFKRISRDITFGIRRNGKERLQRWQWWSSCVPVVPGGNWIEKIKQLIFFPRTSSTLSLCDQGRDCELWTFSLWHPHPKRVHPGGRLQVVPIFKDDNFWSGIGCTAWCQTPDYPVTFLFAGTG